MILNPDVRAAHQALIDEGLIEWNGQYRNGQKVYVITTKGKIRAVKEDQK